MLLSTLQYFTGNPTCVERPESVNTAPNRVKHVCQTCHDCERVNGVKTELSVKKESDRGGSLSRGSLMVYVNLELNTNKSLDVDFQESGFTSR